MRKYHYLALLFLLVSTSCHSTRKENPTTAEALRVFGDQQMSWNAGNLDEFVSKGYWNDAALTLFSNGEIVKGYDQVLARYRERFGESELGKLTFTGFETVGVTDTLIVVRGRWRIDYSAQDDREGLFTLVLRKIDGEWRIIHDHNSISA
ncbi:MAG: nuclear transport factor 2 family protein [Planctomycetes bacterium]|nr:nuclear transport factor 2 family protein [Planctomycetota bacterium]MCB9905470.1 nuclear transport factor 2 family protein [Planctomycetota bacterium]